MFLKLNRMVIGCAAIKPMPAHSKSREISL